MTTDAEHGEQVRARLAAATPGPWRADDERAEWPGSHPSWVVSLTDDKGAYRGDLVYVVHDDAWNDDAPAPQEQADAELIAQAPADLTRLLARAEKAEAERDAWRDQSGRNGVVLYAMQRERDEALAKVAAVAALASKREPLSACAQECGFCGCIGTCDRLAELRTYVWTDDVRAALGEVQQ